MVGVYEPLKERAHLGTIKIHGSNLLSFCVPVMKVPMHVVVV